MNTVKFSLLFLIMFALTNTSFAGQADDKSEADPECDYITEVDTLQYCLRVIYQIGGLRVAVFVWAVSQFVAGVLRTQMLQYVALLGL